MAVKGIWTSKEFKDNTKVQDKWGRKPALLEIDKAIDALHKAKQDDVLGALYDTLGACYNWVDLHQATTGNIKEVKEGIKFSNRRKGIDELIQQLKEKIDGIECTKSMADKLLPGNKNDPRNDKGRAAFHLELLEATIKRAKKLKHKFSDLDTQQFGYVVATMALKIDSLIDKEKHARCKVEALRVLTTMLGRNDELAAQFFEQDIEVVVVPADRAMTDLPEFKSLKDVKVKQSSGTDRTWNSTRGVGGLVVDKTVYVAITEENLLGTKTSEDVVKGGGCYDKKYSTTAHEFAHALHLYALSKEDKAIITKAFEQRRGGLSIDYEKKLAIVTNGKYLLDEDEYDEYFTEEWVDGPRHMKDKSQNELTYAVYDEKKSPVLKDKQPVKFTSKYVLQDCYAAVDDREYFAQVVCCYLGCNGGKDPLTKNARHNEPKWVRENEPKALVELLDRLFGGKSDSKQGTPRLDNTNDELTLGDVLSNPKVIEKMLALRPVY